MKKLGIYIVSFLMVLTLVGCTKGQNTNKKADIVKTYKLVHQDKWDMINDSMTFTTKNEKLVKMVETNVYDQSLDPEVKQQAVKSSLESDSSYYQGTDKYTYKLQQQKDNVYKVILTYNLKNYSVNELLSDQLLKNGKFNSKHAIKELRSQGYVLKKTVVN